MRRLLFPAFITLTLAFSACSLVSKPAVPDDTTSSSSSSSEDTGDLVTHNVSYTGVIDKLEDSIYQEGTHKLMLDDGQFLILASTDANLTLDTYLGKRVEIHGSVQPTVEGSGMLLKAEEVIVLDVPSSETSSSEATSEGVKKMCGGIAGIPCDANQDCVDDPSDSCDPMHGGADCSGMCVTRGTDSTSSSSSEMTSSAVSSTSSVMSSSSKTSSSVMSSKSSSISSSSSVSSSQTSVPADSAAMEQQNVQLAKQIYDQESLWTQKYCTSHIAFCIPIHKNWYFKSFGATTSNLWHVELGFNDIAELGQGAVILNLVSGTSASMQAQDGQIKTQGKDVIGFKDWQDNSHFELIADARLKAAVSYMLSHITSYAGAQ